MTRPVQLPVPPGAAPPQRHPQAPAPGTKIPSHYSHCYGCGEEQPRGLRMQVTAGEGVSVLAEFTVTEDHQGAPGLAHGGLLAVAFDEATGFVNHLLGMIAVTGRLETDYLMPVPVDSTLHIRAWCEGVAGRKIYNFAEGRLGGPGGPVAMRAAALYVRVDLNHFTDHGREADVRAVMDDPDKIRMGRAFEVNP